LSNLDGRTKLTIKLGGIWGYGPPDMGQEKEMFALIDGA
jgi:hypothetical protein